MSPERYEAVMADIKAGLSEEEIATGWHFSIEWDGLLIGPGMDECNYCGCDICKEHGLLTDDPGGLGQLLGREPV